MNIYIHPITGHCATSEDPIPGYEKCIDFDPIEEEIEDPLFQSIWEVVQYWMIDCAEYSETPGAYPHAKMIYDRIKQDENR